MTLPNGTLVKRRLVTVNAPGMDDFNSICGFWFIVKGLENGIYDLVVDPQSPKKGRRGEHYYVPEPMMVPGYFDYPLNILTGVETSVIAGRTGRDYQELTVNLTFRFSGGECVTGSVHACASKVSGEHAHSNESLALEREVESQLPGIKLDRSFLHIVGIAIRQAVSTYMSKQREAVPA